MKKGFWPAFLAGFFGPFFSITALLYILTAGFRLLDNNTLMQCLVITGSVSLLISAFTAISRVLQEDFHEQDDMRSELTQEAGIFFRAVLILRLRAFFPFWLALITLITGLFLSSGTQSMFGCLLLLTGQAFWFLIRRRLRTFIDTAPMDNHLYPYLLWILRGTDAFTLFTITSVMAALGAYGEIVDNIALLAVSALLAVVFVISQAFRLKQTLEMDHALKTGVAFVWIALVIATINFGFDFRPARGTRRLTYSQCIDYRDSVLSGKASPNDELKDCHYFSLVKSPRLDSVIELTDHQGALGISWQKAKPAP